MASSDKNDLETASWLTRIEAADLLNVTIETLIRWEKDGRLHPRRRRTSRAAPPCVIYDPKELARIPIRGRRGTPRTTGEIESRIFELLTGGASLVDIVIVTEQALDYVERVRDRWLELGGERMGLSKRQCELLAAIVGPFGDGAELIANVQTALGDRVYDEAIDAALDAAGAKRP